MLDVTARLPAEPSQAGDSCGHLRRELRQPVIPDSGHGRGVRRWRSCWTGAPAPWGGCGGWGWPGSSRRCAGNCLAGAPPARACGSSARSSTRSVTRPGWPRTVPARWSAPTWSLDDWRETRRRRAETETRMVGVLDELDLTDLVTSIDGLTAVGAAAILAETGDPARFRSPRAVVKHAGLCPRDNASGQHQGRSAISRRGRPALRLAAWRAVWAALPNNPGARRPIHPPDHPRGQPPRPPAGPRRLRRRPAALAARRRGPTRPLGPGHRRRRQAGDPRRLTDSGDLKPGRGEPKRPSRTTPRA